MTCPDCKEPAKFMGYRHTTLLCLFGKVDYERAYYHCEACGHGHFPTDQEFDVENRKTRAAEEVIALGTVTDAFKEAAEKLVAKMSGLVVSKSTVHRTAEDVGDRGLDFGGQLLRHIAADVAALAGRGALRMLARQGCKGLTLEQPAACFCGLGFRSRLAVVGRVRRRLRLHGRRSASAGHGCRHGRDHRPDVAFHDHGGRRATHLHGERDHRRRAAAVACVPR